MIRRESLLLTFLLLSGIRAYPDGAPGCVLPSTTDMSEGRSGNGGFFILAENSAGTMDKTSYQPGERLKISVNSDDSTPFKGLLIHAVQGSPGMECHRYCDPE